MTAQQAALEGFSEEEIDLLMAAGVVLPPEQRGPFVPTTLAHVDWVIAKRKQIAAERELLERWHAERMAINDRAQRLFDRYDADCQRITEENLERKPDGSFRKKSIVLPHGKVKLTSSAGGPKVVDEAALLDHIRESRCGSEFGLWLGLKVVQTYTGENAIRRLDEPGAKASIQLAPVKAYVASLPEQVDPETGEAKPATIPGVEIVAPSERWSFE